MIAGLSAIQGCAPPVQGVKQEETVLRFKMQSLAGEEDGVTFDMFAKVEVNGENACELYKFLTSLDTKPKGAGKIAWNFEKFLIDRNGTVVARFGSGTKPDDPEIVATIERELAKAAASRGELQKPVAR